MSGELVVEREVHFRRRGPRKLLQPGADPAPELPPGRVPRVARLMALALRMERLVCAGEVDNYAHLARLGQVTRARVTQIMNLLHLAPDIQEAVLFLPLTLSGRDAVNVRDLQPVTAVPGWGEQRRLWRALIRSRLGVKAIDVAPE